MTTLELEERNLILQIPSHWDEMTTDQVFYTLKTILEINSRLSKGGASESALQRDLILAQIKIFYHLTGIRRTWRTILWEHIMPRHIIIEKNDNIITLAQQCTKFLFTEINQEEIPPSKGGSRRQGGYELNYNTILNHFPVIKTRTVILSKAKDLHGPSHLLSDITFGEFRSAIEELNEYFEECRSEEPIPPSKGGSRRQGGSHQLNRFLATLYRPQRKNYHQLVKSETFDGSRREPFNRNLIDKNARYTALMHPVHKQAILLWFTYTINYIQTEELTISGRTISLKSIFNKGKETSNSQPATRNSNSGWSSILYSIAKEGVFGNIEQTDKTGLFDILLYLYDQHQENQRLKAKYQKKGK